jgi:hypothetical protein
VTSKPDLYPLVFSYNNDGSKNGSNGANYLMVQYFRNYIVRPIGSLSATSTIDSLSSSFICTANEANTMIPPPYSSAASPDDISISLQNYAIPHSASNVQLEAQNLVVNASNNRPMSVPNTNYTAAINSQYEFRSSESANFSNLFQSHEGNDCKTLENQNSNIPTSSNSTMTTTHTGSSRNANISISDDDDEFHPASEGASQEIPISNNENQTSIYNSNDTMLSLSAAMIDKIAYTCQTNDHTKLNMIQKQLEKCCELIQQQQQQIQQTRSHFNITTSFDSASGSPINYDMGKKMGISYLNSNTGSTVSSLANLHSPSSPPQAISPTQEVKDLLEQIRQLKDKTFSDEELNINVQKDSSRDVDQAGPSTEITITSSMQASARPILKRPTTLSSKRRFFNMKNRSVYLPISNNYANTGPYTSPSGFNTKLRSPISGTANVFMKSRGIKCRNGWVSKSLPSTPGTFPINDHSPLLNEQDEDADANC